MPTGSEVAERLRKLIKSTQVMILPFATSQQHYLLLPWGCSVKQNIPLFEVLYQRTAATVCSTEIVRGISLAMGMDTPEIVGATADIDTDLNEKRKVALELAKSHDFVCIHINGTDEASHRKRPKEKADFLKRIDIELIGQLLDQCDDDTNIMICCDHSTLSDTGSHRGGLQPFILYNKSKPQRGNIGQYNGNEAIKLLLGEFKGME